MLHAPAPLVVLGIDGAGKTSAIAELIGALGQAAVPVQQLANPAGRRWLTRCATRYGVPVTAGFHDRFEVVVRTANVALNTLRARLLPGLSVMDRHLVCQQVLRQVRGVPVGTVLPALAERSLRSSRVVLLDVDAGTAYQRIIARDDDYESWDYLAASRRAYLRLAADNGWTVIDASQPLPRVVAQLRAVAAR